MSNALLRINLALSERYGRIWSRAGSNLGSAYVTQVRGTIQESSHVTDVGAGRDTPFAEGLDRQYHLLGVDLLADDLAANAALSERVTSDVARDGLPPQAEGSDVVCSRFVLEHLPDLEAFAKEAHRSLSPGGITIHLFAGRWSPFAVANRLLPTRLAHRVLFSLRPESRDVGGFLTHYDRTDPKAARMTFERAGFREVQTMLSWEISQYCRWCFPLFLAARAWEGTTRYFRIEAVASYVLLTGRRPDQARTDIIEGVQLPEAPDIIEARRFGRSLRRRARTG